MQRGLGTNDSAHSAHAGKAAWVSCRPGDFRTCFEWNARPDCTPARKLRASNDRYRSRGLSRGYTTPAWLPQAGGVCILHSSSHRKSRTVIAAAHNPAATIAAPRAGKIIQKRFRLLIMASQRGRSKFVLSSCFVIEPDISGIS
jgi:hypothetical protein